MAEFLHKRIFMLAGKLAAETPRTHCYIAALENASALAGVSSGSVGSISGGTSSSGVSVLQQAGTESSSNKLATGSGTNTLQYSNGYVSINSSQKPMR